MRYLIRAWKWLTARRSTNTYYTEFFFWRLWIVVAMFACASFVALMAVMLFAIGMQWLFDHARWLFGILLFAIGVTAVTKLVHFADQS